ncbi:MAG TPA: DUF58 domain-containing protein [Gemmatimonadaceae bacterium]
MQQLTSGALLDAVRGVHWPARRITGGAFQGAHRSKRVGYSPEFTAYRPYQQGDDPAKIDWKLFGRTERVAIRLSHDESNLRTTVMVDASASMAYPPSTLAKWELAAAVALGLCAVAHADTDPVGVAVVDGAGLRALPARTRRGTVANVLRMLLDTTPSGSTPLAPSLGALRSSRRIAIVSDFLGDADALLEQAREMVAGGREVYAVHIVAAEELDPSALGPVVTDPEDATIRRPLEERELAEYHESFGRWREALAASWRAAGAVYQLATTGEAPERVVRRVVTPVLTADASA